MQFQSRLLLLAVLLAVVPPSSAWAQDAADSLERPIFDRPICEPPISVCNSRLAEPSLTSSIFRECPLGYECACVPSHPNADDCPVEVCILDQGRECRTACDCPTGLGCFDGQCIAGFAPVFCCDDPDRCPPGQQCQSSDGTRDRCEMPGDPMCEERRKKAAVAVEEVVERYSACREDRDCVRVDTSTQCMGTCGDFVNRDHAPVVERMINRFDRRICSGYREAGCPFLTPACQLQRPACVENKCTGKPFDFIPLPRPLPHPLPHPLPLEPVVINGSAGVSSVEAMP